MSVSKECTSCHVVKPLDAFSPNKTGRYGKSSWCRDCSRERVAAYRRTNREAYRRQQAIAGARNRALTCLAEKHPDEFAELVRAEMAAVGVAYYDDLVAS